jgi:hypothetical protein
MTDKALTYKTRPYVRAIGGSLHIPFVVNYDESAAAYSPTVDAFGRARVSQPETIFESNFISGGTQEERKDPIFWSESITNNSGAASSVHSLDNAEITLSAGQNDTIIRQTKQMFSYQPGKSQVGNFTGKLGSGGNGITSRIGFYDGANGLYFENKDGIPGVCIEKNGVVTRIDQSDWNVDPMDGTGNSGLTVDFDNNQIYWIEYEWLGVGGVGFAIFINRALYYVHWQNFANNSNDGAYIPNPNLPIRYSVSNTGSTVANLTQICSTVFSEGGVKPLGQIRSQSIGTTSGSEIQAGVVGTDYAVCSIRLKDTHLMKTVKPTNISVLMTTTGNIQWSLQLNPTLSGGLSYVDVKNSAVQFAAGAPSGTTITERGTTIAKGYISNDLESLVTDINSLYSLGAEIDGTRDELVLVVNPVNAGQDVLGAISWREQ